MPLLASIVYPAERNKCNIEHTIHIWNILRSWFREMELDESLNKALAKAWMTYTTYEHPRWSKMRQIQEHQANESPDSHPRRNRNPLKNNGKKRNKGLISDLCDESLVLLRLLSNLDGLLGEDLLSLILRLNNPLAIEIKQSKSTPIEKWINKKRRENTLDFSAILCLTLRKVSVSSRVCPSSAINPVFPSFLNSRAWRSNRTRELRLQYYITVFHI